MRHGSGAANYLENLASNRVVVLLLTQLQNISVAVSRVTITYSSKRSASFKPTTINVIGITTA
jgi:hypothetical protein